MRTTGRTLLSTAIIIAAVCASRPSFADEEGMPPSPTPNAKQEARWFGCEALPGHAVATIVNAGSVARAPHRTDLRLPHMAGSGGDMLQLALQQLYDLGKVDRSTEDAHLAGVDARKVQEIRRQLGQTLNLPLHGLDEATPRLLVELLVHEKLEKPADREQGRPKLV